MNTKTLSVVAISLIIGFGVGYMVHTTPAPTALNAPGGFTRGAGMRSGNMASGGFLSGTVATLSSGSLTLNTRDGSSHVVILTPATTVSKSVSGALTDVSVGATVMVQGATNSDGSVSASVIQLRPTPPATTP